MIYALLLGCAMGSPRFGEAPMEWTLEHESIGARGLESSWSLETKFSAPLLVREGNVVALTGSYEESYLNTDWDFTELKEQSLGIFSVTKVRQDWRIMTQTRVNSALAGDAKFSGGLSYRGMYGAWYNFNDRFSFGLGAGMVDDIDGRFSWFPLVFLDWEMMSGLTLTTRPTPGTRFGPGVSLMYEAAEDWVVYTGWRAVARDYYIREGDLLRVEANRVFVTLQHFLSEEFSLSVTAGMGLGGQVRRFRYEEGVSTSYFGGISADYRF